MRLPFKARLVMWFWTTLGKMLADLMAWYERVSPVKMVLAKHGDGLAGGQPTQERKA